MKKAVLYSSSINNYAGGGLVYLLETALALKEIGYNVTCRLKFSIDLGTIKENYKFDGLKLESYNGEGLSLLQQIQLALKEFFNFDLIIYHANQPPRINFIRKSYILCDFPMVNKLGYKERIRINSWQGIIVNSRYTQSWVWNYWKKTSEILYPPVSQFHFTGKNPFMLLSIGRFHGGGRSKRQDLIIEAFIKLSNLSSLNWQLHLAGFVQSEKYLKQLREKAFGYNVIFHENISNIKKEQLLSICGIYIHACGYGIDQDQNPDLAEHYGISVVEAMASGCVPLVVAKGGPAEIVDNEKNGFYWEDIDQLIKQILLLSEDKNLFKLLAEKSVNKALLYSPKIFQKKLKNLLITR